jgi:cysteine desulfurase/selenocysteine lyase
MSFDINKVRNDFPILSKEIEGKPLIYFDNGATTQKPIQVIDRISDYYRYENSNVHRGNHYLSNEATEAFENARKYIAGFISAKSSKEIIFTKGTTESINLVASSFEGLLTTGDEIIITEMEHHSNIVPWQQLCIKKECELRIAKIDQDGKLDLEDFAELINRKTKFVAVTHISNVLGTINPVKEIVQIAHNNNVPVIIDGAQAIAHLAVDVKDIDCDFYAFSAHKAYGPMGTGVLYGKEEWLNRLSPYQYGGEMIESVSFTETTFNELPYKFEAGTPNVAGVLGMESALRYISELGIKNIQAHEDKLLEYATDMISEIAGVRIIGNADIKTSVLSLNVEGVHPYDLGTLLDQVGIAVRTGNHCAQPLMDKYLLPGTLRASLGVYNSVGEIDTFVSYLKKVIQMLR